MNEKIKSIAIIVLIVVILILLGILAYFYFRKKHTREKFAFFSVITLSTIALFILGSILSGQSIWGIFTHAINEILGVKIPIKEPTMVEQLFALLIFYLMRNTVLRIYKGWKSEVKTEREYEIYRKNLRSSIVSDFLIQSRDFFSKEELLKLYKPEERGNQYNFLGELNNSKLPWGQNAAEILQLTSNQYKIEIDDDWYREQSCYISEFGKDKTPICIFCSTDEPNEKELKKLFKFLRRTKNRKIENVIFLIENGNFTKSELNQEGFFITKRYKQEILDNLVDFSKYFDYVDKRFNKEEVSLGTSTKLRDIYVPVSGMSESNKSHIENIEEHLIEWVKDDNSNRHLAILGDYGQGKSVLALKLTLELIERETKRIPILIELRGKSPRNLDPLEILATWTSNLGINPLSILKLHFEGRIILIFEGFDEMDLVGDAEMRLNHFRNLWNFAKTPKSKILISGRPNFFLDDIEQKEALGIYKPLSPDIPHCEAIYLKSFSNEQIKLALRNSSVHTREGIFRIISDKDSSEYSERFYDLVSRPSTLFLISAIWKGAKFSERKDNINSAIVIREFIQSAYERQGQRGDITPLTVKEREYFMLGIAVGMMRKNGYSNQISKNKLNDLVIELYNSFPEDFTSTSSAFEKSKKPLKQRMKDNEEIAKESILTDVRSCGILVKDLSKINHFKFAHKSFLEYLVSEYYVISLLQKDNTKTDMFYSISKAIKDSTPIKESKETIDFISQLLAGEFFEEKELKHELLAKKIMKVLHRSKFINPNFLSFVLSNVRQLLLALLLFMLIAMLFPLISDFNSGELFSKSTRDSSGSIDTVFIFLLLGSSVIISLFLKLKIRESDLEKEDDSENIGFATKVKIWYMSCKELGINDDVLCKLIYPKFLKTINEDSNSSTE